MITSSSFKDNHRQTVPVSILRPPIVDPVLNQNRSKADGHDHHYRSSNPRRHLSPDG